MTGYQSKRTAALDEEGMYLVHQTASYADNLRKSIVALGKQTAADIEQLGIQPAQEPWRESASDYERGFIDGMQKQAQSSVDKAVNRMAQRPWVGLTDEERRSIREWQRIQEELGAVWSPMMLYLYEAIEAKLKEKNS